MRDTDASQTLLEVERVRRSTRELLDVSWFPFLLWGSLVMVSAPFTQIGDGAAIAIYWILVSLVAVPVHSRYYRRREISLGVFHRNAHAYLAIIAGMVIGAMLIGALANGILADVGAVYPIALGLLGIGLLNRSALFAATAIALAAVATGLLIAAPQDAALYAALGEGAIMVLAGGFAFVGDRSRGLAGRGESAAAAGG